MNSKVIMFKVVHPHKTHFSKVLLSTSIIPTASHTRFSNKNLLFFPNVQYTPFLNDPNNTSEEHNLQSITMFYSIQRCCNKLMTN